MIGAFLLVIIFIVLAIISLVLTVFAVAVGTEAMSWTIVWKKIDWSAIAAFFSVAVVAAIGWMATTYTGYLIWARFD